MKKYIIVYIVCSILAVPLVSNISTKPISFGDAIIYTALGPTVFLAVGLMSLNRFLDNRCVANCGK